MVDYELGQYLKLAERIRNAVDAKAEAGHYLRIRTEDAVVSVAPTWNDKNIHQGTLIGALTAAIASVAQTYVPIRADTDVTDKEPVDGGILYTVDVNAAFRNQAMFRSMIDAGTGYTSLITDKFNIQDEEVIKKRPLRDTYQFKILVEDTDIDAESRIDILGNVIDTEA